MKNSQLSIFSKNMKTVTHDQLCDIAAKYFKRVFKLKAVTVNNRLMYNDEKPDVFGFNTMATNSFLIEVKVSRADFLRDKNKMFRKYPNKGMGNYRYYCCPEGLIAVADLPAGWGLLYYRPGFNDIIEMRPAGRRVDINKRSERYLLLYYLRFPVKYKENVR
jgi:hypothetical protein